MSGHSKWHNIRVKKTAADAKRGKIYTRHAKLIEIAAQRGGDPDTNPGLRTAIDNAKADNVPNANIDRAIKKGTGEMKGERMEEVLYAGYGPGNTAILIECLTDNRNRTLANIKVALTKNGGSFAETGSVLWMFERSGVVVAQDRGSGIGEREELALIDLGARDIDIGGGFITVITDASSWTGVRDYLKQAGFAIRSAGLAYIPMQKSEINDEETAKKLAQIIDALEEDDDVADVHTNAEIEPEIAARFS